MTLYRGISLEPSAADKLIQNIVENGVDEHPDQFWKPNIWKDLSGQLMSLRSKQNLTRQETRPATEWIITENGGYAREIEGYPCICFADRVGAEYYATRHNITKDKTVAVLISIETDLRSVCIDGKDFLYTAIQFININERGTYEKQCSILSQIFGPSIMLYVEKLIQNPLMDRIAIADLIINDPDIILYHYGNTKVIGGRHGTIFRSSFNVRIPIHSSRILSVQKIAPQSSFNIDISLQDFLGR